MNVLVVKVQNENNIPLLKKLIGIFKEKISVLSEEEYRDSKFAELLEEGLKTKTLSEKEAKKEFRKRGIRI